MQWGRRLRIPTPEISRHEVRSGQCFEGFLEGQEPLPALLVRRDSHSSPSLAKGHLHLGVAHLRPTVPRPVAAAHLAPPTGILKMYSTMASLELHRPIPPPAVAARARRPGQSQKVLHLPRAKGPKRSRSKLFPDLRDAHRCSARAWPAAGRPPTGSAGGPRSPRGCRALSGRSIRGRFGMPMSSAEARSPTRFPLAFQFPYRFAGGVGCRGRGRHPGCGRSGTAPSMLPAPRISRSRMAMRKPAPNFRRLQNCLEPHLCCFRDAASPRGHQVGVRPVLTPRRPRPR